MGGEDMPAISSQEATATSRARRAFLATRRDELLGPIQAMLTVSDRILTDAKAAEQARFTDDVRHIRQAALDLLAIVQEVLAPARLELTSEAEFDRLRSRLRHDMLNKLNPVINYSDMWLEESEEFFLQGVVSDLKMLHSLGKHCFSLIDTILASWNMQESIAVSALPDFGKIEEMVKRMTVSQPATAEEHGSMLVVDDNEINRDILRRLLESQGHTVTTAENGRRALDLVGQGAFDLVLLDIVMPEMDGFTVLMELKANPRVRDIPVIMISALNEIEYVVSCIKLGAEDYLTRPYNPVFLKARVGACLEKKRLREREQQHLAEIQKERLRSDELLHVILPREIVSELKATNTVVPRRYDGVAVLFADIVGFTPYCEQHSAEEVVSHLQQLVELWEEAALQFKVQKIKTIGDAFMAACGLLTPVDEPVLNCIRFGTEMIRATESTSFGWTVRVGIHVGHVVAGVLGRRQYLFDMFGDTVNTAARMESHGVEGGIVLSSDAWEQVHQRCHGIRLDSVAVKGKGVVDRHQFCGFRNDGDAQV